MRRELNICISIIFAGLLAGFPGASKADPLDGLTLGAGLKVMGDQAKEVLEKAIRSRSYI
jgi:hypothetical protein